jgi:four helix bundle protein
MSYFDHEKLDVYRVAIQFNVLIDKVVEGLPRGRSYLADQLQRAGASIPLNIAEGAGEYASNEKIRFYRIAKRSATECAAIFDLCQELRLIEEENYMQGRELLLRIVAMLIRMAQGSNQIKSGTHTGTHAGTKLVTP